VLDVELVVPPSIKLASSREMEHLDAYDDTSYVISVKQRKLDPDKRKSTGNSVSQPCMIYGSLTNCWLLQSAGCW
jgi:hypothetical protein